MDHELLSRASSRTRLSLRLKVERLVGWRGTRSWRGADVTRGSISTVCLPRYCGSIFPPTIRPAVREERRCVGISVNDRGSRVQPSRGNMGIRKQRRGGEVERANGARSRKGSVGPMQIRPCLKIWCSTFSPESEVLRSPWN